MPTNPDWIEEAAKEAGKRLNLGGIARVTLLTILREHQPTTPSPSVPEVVSDARAGEMQRTILELRRVNKEMKSRGIEVEVLPLAAQDLFVLLRDRAARVAEAAAKDERIANLEKFKAYVHQRLDDAGVPVDPPSSHREHGCRIGGRLDCLLCPPAKEVEDENG